MLNNFGMVPVMDRTQMPGNTRRDSSMSVGRAGGRSDQRGDSSSRHRSISPSKISHKGHLKIHIQGFVVLIHPPEQKIEIAGEAPDSQAVQPQEDTLLEGRLEIVMDKSRTAKAIRVELIVTCRLQLPGEIQWQDREIFNRMVEIGNSSEESEGITLEKGSQTFEFAIIVPATMATYDRHPYGRVSQTLRATVEGFPQQVVHHHSSFNLFSGMGIGGKRDRSRAESRSRAGSRPSSRAPSPNRLPRTGSTTQFDTQLSHRSGNHSNPTTPGLDEQDIAFPLPSAGEMKPLKGTLQTERHLIVAGNPSSNYGEGLTSLSMQKSGRLAGVGDWKLSLTSDAFSVGSYLTQRLLFLSPSPFATIFAVRLLLNQTYSVTDLDHFDASHSPAELAALKWHQCPKRSFLVSLEGSIPHSKRPALDVPALWRGSLVGKADIKKMKEQDIPFEADYKLKTGRKRLPDDSKARPSTIDGTITPIRVNHDLVVQVFFSVNGEDLHGNPIEGEDQSGVMRMLVLTLPTVLPSCTCTFERVTLPEYCEVQEPFTLKHAGACACGNTMEDFARREADRTDAGQDDDVDLLDVDGLNLDGRGRSRGRGSERRKAEYDGSHTPSYSRDRSQDGRGRT